MLGRCGRTRRGSVLVVVAIVLVLWRPHRARRGSGFALIVAGRGRELGRVVGGFLAARSGDVRARAPGMVRLGLVVIMLAPRRDGDQARPGGRERGRGGRAWTRGSRRAGTFRGRRTRARRRRAA